MTLPTTPSPRLCLWLVGIGGLVLVVLSVAFVPWSWVPGGHLVDVRGSEVFTSSQLSRSAAYSTTQRRIGWGSLAGSLVLALALGLTPAGSRIARVVRGPWWLRVLATTLVVLLAGALVTLPLDLVARHRAMQFGLTHQALGGWFHDQGVSLLVSWVFAGLTLLLVIGTARRSPRRWPLWTGVAGALLTVAGSWVYPVVVEPLFNHFTPLAQGELRTRILELARKEHVPVSDVLVADASRRTTTLNAYVSGFGGTRRVVLYDNLVDDVPQHETLVVVAHELGHAENNDVLHGTLLGAAGVVLGSGLLGIVLSRRWVLRRAAVEDPGRPEAVALLLLIAALGSLLASPVENTMSRAVEARADRASLSATGDYAGFQRLQVDLAARSLSAATPPKWSQFWFGSHPTATQRIGMARALQRLGH